MEEQVTLLVGTMTGTADLVAEEVRDTLEGEGVEAKVFAMDRLDLAIVGKPGLFLICSSTYGQGDVPDNARDFFALLERVRPDLSKLSYGVIALGDRTYAQTYCQGGLRFDALLTALGAHRIGEVFRHDASAGTVPEEVACAWVKGWIGECRRFLAERDQAA
ncbi:MAG TPA: flavodoxin domain-containing protein [Stellaceae bacterium]|nr:flavodoxin domain-containing protein [Stellaceae bacterium]